MGTTEQRQYPRLGLGLPVTVMFAGHDPIGAELQDISRGGCFFKARATIPLDRRISVMLSANGGKKIQASGRVVRTVAYKGFAVLFDESDNQDVDELLRDLAPLPPESRAAALSEKLQPEIQIY